MNRENIKKVRDVIASLPRGRFNMGDWVSNLDLTPKQLAHTCGTAACIAGWTLAVKSPGSRKRYWDSVDNIEEVAGRYLGLSLDEAKRLFIPPGLSIWKYTQPHAVRVLDHLLATGEVDWKSTRRAKKAGAK